MAGPQPDQIDRDLVAPAVVSLSSAELQDDLTRALETAGYAVRFGSVEDLARVVEPAVPTVVVLDDDHHDWLRIVAELVVELPEAIPILLTSVDSAEVFLSAVSAGVAGFCPADAGVRSIVRTVEAARTSGVAIPRSFVPTLVEHVRHGRGHRVETAAGSIDVTDREWDVLQLLLQRLSTREMAEALFVSIGTVRSHISTLLKKLGAVDREDAISLVERGRPPMTD